MAIFRPTRRLNSADLPTFGRPTIATFGMAAGSLILTEAQDVCDSASPLDQGERIEVRVHIYLTTRTLTLTSPLRKERRTVVGMHCHPGRSRISPDEHGRRPATAERRRSHK